MNNSKEIVVWNTLRGMRLSNRCGYDDLVKEGVRFNQTCLFIAFVPHDEDTPIFLDAFHFHQVISTNLGRYFIADALKEALHEEVEQQIA